MTKTIYTIGYGSRAPEDVFAILDSLGAILVDIRFSAWGKPGWKLFELQRALGARYMHVKALGNAAYKTGGMEIANYEQGRAVLEGLDRPAVLLCACHHPIGCHRTVVGDMLRRDGFTVTELHQAPAAAQAAAPAQSDPDEQLTLWG